MTDFTNIRVRGRTLQLVASDYTKTSVKTIKKAAPYLLSTKKSRYPVMRKHCPQGETLYKHHVQLPGDIYDLKDLLVNGGHSIYEHDILYKYRYLIDAGIYCKMPTGPTLVFDIEVMNPRGTPDPRKDAIVAISWACGGEQGVICGLNSGIGNEDINNPKIGPEGYVLREFEKLIKKLNPTIITGYNIFDFDLPYIEARLGHDLRIPGGYFKRFNKQKAKYEYEGFACQFIDLYLLTKMRAPSMPDYKLDTVCHKLFGIGKTEDAGMPTAEMIEKGVLEEYALRDAEITMMLWEYFEPLLKGLIDLCGYPVQNVAMFSSGNFVEMYLIRKSVEQELWVPNKNT